MPKNDLNQHIEKIFAEIGQFGPYQLFIFIIAGSTTFVPAIVGYGPSFYAAVPPHRCKIPGLSNDTYEVWNAEHQYLVNQYVPLSKDNAFKDIYNKCNLKVFNNETIDIANSTGFRLEKCSEWVFSKKYFDNTLGTEWNMVCDKAAMKSVFATLYFIGSYTVILNGILSDKFGRKQTAYVLLVLNTICNFFVTVMVSFDFGLSRGVLQTAFGVIRLFSGATANFYSIAVVLVIECCGSSNRVFAVNSIYYMFIFAEFVVVFLAWQLRTYRSLITAYTCVTCSIIFYFWLVPESPRWLMTKKKYAKAYDVFARIAKSNKKSTECLKEIEALKVKELANKTDNDSKEDNTDELESCDELELQKLHNKDTTSDVDEHEASQQQQLAKPLQKSNEKISFLQTIKILFTTRKIVLQFLVTLLNWLTNSLVYYGISYNTSDLSGNPYLNFSLSAFVELLSVIMCQLTLERFGRKRPYCIAMLLSGLSLLCVMFIPARLPYLITCLVLVGKFAISFTYNAIYIISAESYPTSIRNTLVAIAQSFGRLGSIIAPSIQLLGDLYFYPIPFIIYGSLATVAALLFGIFLPETKGRKLPDTLEEYVN